MKRADVVAELERLVRVNDRSAETREGQGIYDDFVVGCRARAFAYGYAVDLLEGRRTPVFEDDEAVTRLLKRKGHDQ